MQPILIVEDDHGLRQALHYALEEEGWPVDAVGDERQALDWIVRTQPALVVLDWGLPDFDGQVVATGLRQAHGEMVPLLLITAAADHLREKAQATQAYAYLRKPCELDDLIELVRRGLNEPEAASHAG